MPGRMGTGESRSAAPHARLGFYRVGAELSNGLLLHDLGTRPAGFLTYAVVPDPAKRADLDEDKSHFAMQGAPWDKKKSALIGARWVLDDGLQWRRAEPKHAGEFGPEQARRLLPGPARLPATGSIRCRHSRLS